MTWIALVKYNNYYNRKKKKLETADAYVTAHIAATSSSAYIEGYTRELDPKDVNFWENDGVNTAHVFNCSKDEIDVADYAVVFNSTDYSIFSRWYIMDAVKNTYGQYNVTLHRDVIADNWDEAMNATGLIARGPLYNKYSKLLFNSEGNTYNRIKRSEYQLTDATKTPWIVGYLTPPTTENPDQGDYYVIQYQPSVSEDDGTVLSLTAQEYNTITGLADGTIKILYQVNIGSKNRDSGGWKDRTAFLSNENALWYVDSVFSNGNYRVSVRTPEDWTNSIEQLWIGYHAEHAADYNSAVGSLGTPPGTISVEDYNDLLAKIENRTVEYNGATYQVSMARTGNLTSVVAETSNVNVNNYLVDFWTYAKAALPAGIQAVFTGQETPDGFGVKNIYNYVKEDVNVTIGVTSGRKVGVDIHKSHDQLDDAPWSMFAIPLFPVKAKWASTYANIDHPDLNMTTTTQSAITIARAIIERWGGNFLKDIQIVPWCPMQECVEIDDVTKEATINMALLHRNSYGQTVAENAFRWSKVSELVSVQNNTETWSAVNLMLWCNTCSGTAPLRGPSIDLPYAYTPKEYKVISETHVARLVSPNQNGIFEFSPASNYGVHAEEWIGRWTYKPFSPFIQVTPYWRENGLYGGTWKDTRGLICQGDFSMPQTSSAWETYAVNNKNYQAAFDRQIDNLQFTQHQERIHAGVGIATGAVKGGISGAVSGAAKGGPWGAVAGAVVGAGLSVGGAIVDYNMMTARQREAQDYAEDMFRMNLENIMAQPASINRVGATDYSFRYFPILELYTATEEEENALREQIEKTGFRLGVMGRVADFLGTANEQYIQAQINRLPEELNGDYHMATEIAGEFARGIYIKQ